VQRVRKFLFTINQYGRLHVEREREVFDYDSGMQDLRHGRRIALVLVIVLTGAALGGCGWFGSEPERRARAFIEALVRTPGEIETLHAFVARAPGVDPLAFTDEPPMRVALEYLRAKHQTGESLDFSSFETAQPNQDARRVVVRVRIGATRPATDEVVFSLELERESGGVWLVARANVVQ
jgi:hypothetical protein